MNKPITRTALASLLTLYSLGGFAFAVNEENKLNGNGTVLEKKLKSKMNDACEDDNTGKLTLLENKVDNIARTVDTINAKIDNMAQVMCKQQDNEGKKKTFSPFALPRPEPESRNKRVKSNDKAKKNHSMPKTQPISIKVKDEKTKPVMTKPMVKKPIVKKDIKVDTTSEGKGTVGTTRAESKSAISTTKAESKGKYRDLSLQDNRNLKANRDLNLQANSGLQVTFGGEINTQGYFKMKGNDNVDNLYNNIDTENKANERAHDPYASTYSRAMGAGADAILNLKAENVNEDLGLAYGAALQLHLPVTQDGGFTDSIRAIKNRGAHIFVNSQYGDLKLGYQFGPEALMRVDATTIATVDGGADSDWFTKVNVEGYEALSPFTITPRLYTESFTRGSQHITYDMNKNGALINALPFRVSYSSPTYMGLRFSFSYAPSACVADLPGYHHYAEKKRLYKQIKQHLEPAYLSTKKSAPEIIKHGKSTLNNLNIVPATVEEKISKWSTDEKKNVGKLAGQLVELLPGAAYRASNSNSQSEINKISNDHKMTYNETLLGIVKARELYLKDAGLSSKRDKESFLKDLLQKIDKHALGGIADLNTVSTQVNNAFNEKINQSTIKEQDISQVIASEVLNRLIAPSITPSINSAVAKYDKSYSYGPSYEHVTSAGLIYEYDFSDYNLKVKASAIGEYGKAKKATEDNDEYHDLKGLNTGANVDYRINESQVVSLAGSFGYLGNSGEVKTYVEDGKRLNDDAAQSKMYWTTGLKYQYESVSLSGTYFGSRGVPTLESKDAKNDLHHFALGVQYDISPAGSKGKFSPYLALHYFTTNENGVKKEDNNRGTLLLAGIKFSF